MNLLKKKLAQKSLHGMDLINKVNNELYNEKSTIVLDIKYL